MGSKLTIDIEGMAELQKRFKSLDEEGRKRVNSALNLSAVELRRDVIKSIRKRSGRYRQRYYWGKGRKGRKAGVRRGIVAYSSMPGTPPNSDTGNLIKNIRLSRTNAMKRTPVASVISGAIYSNHLEYGSKKSTGRGSGIKARPFMAPALRKKRAIFVARISQAIRGLL